MDRAHFKCWLWKGLWGLAALSLIYTWWVATYRSDPVLGFGALYGFWNALVLGVLAIPIKLDCHTCSVCKIGMR